MPSIKQEEELNIVMKQGDILKKKEFFDAFQKVIDFITEMKKQFEEAIAGIQETHTMLMDKVSNEYDSRHSELKGQVNDVFVGERMNQMNSDQKAHLEEMRIMINDMLDKEMDRGMMNMKNNLSQLRGPEGKPGKHGSPDLAQHIANKLNTEKDIIDLDVIKGLKEALKLLSKKIDNKVVYTGGGNSGGRIVKSYDLSSSLDGSTKTFSLPTFWRIISVHLSSVPNIMRETTDYTSDAAASTITFTDETVASTSLSAGQSLVVVYSE